MKTGRTPTIRGCIKRLFMITVKELEGLGPRDLKNIIKLQAIINAAQKTIKERKETLENSLCSATVAS